MANLKSQGSSIWFIDLSVSPNAYSQIGQVISISGPDGSIGETDVTNLSSSGKEFVANLPDYGSVSMEVSWDPGTPSMNQDELWTYFQAQTSTTFQIRLSDSPQTTLTFTAFPNAYSVSLGVDDYVHATISVRISGGVTLA